ncbi:Uma2 family endonuclease [Botrimarina sp.]|uniref:Uma2 family endonuclease n=1 Tax=Botrimarina sp. TaxID=2795802 RepID=UPI0032EB6905
MPALDASAAPSLIGPESNGVLMTPGEYDATQEWDDRYRYELVNGVLVVLPPPGFGERSPNDYLSYLLNKYREEHPNGNRVDATLPEQDVVCGDNRRRVDRAIWVGVGEAFDPNADVPTIAIEFVSGTARDRRRDYVDKRREYLAAGVKEYWVLDRFARRLTVFQGETVTAYGENEVYRPDLLPGFELPVRVLLERSEPRGG